MDYKPTDPGAPQGCSHLEAALEYAKSGFNVFPLNAKIPLTPNGHKDATTEAEIIRSWYEK